jgi:CheY-like chemotaxis protein
MRTDVLIVEDDAPSREALVALLELQGYATATAGNGAEALTYLGAQEPPRLILLDLIMPVMDGGHFLRARKGKPDLAGIPVVLCTAEGLLDKAAAQALGADDLLQKPVDPDKLLDVVRRHTAADAGS